MRNFLLCVLTLSFGLASVDSKAYIPTSSFILGKTSKTHGKGNYAIEEEVTFSKGLETLVMHEKWIIEDGGTMSLIAKGGGNHVQYVYGSHQKSFKDESGNLKSVRSPSEFFEPFFHIRTQQGFTDALLASQVIPKGALAAKRVPRNLKEVSYTPDPFVRLARSNGVITFALGQPTPVNSPKVFPGVWIEQDRFVVRRLRFPSAAEVAADDYFDYSYELQFPRSRSVTWDQNNVRIQVTKVSTIGSAAAAPLLGAASLNAKEAQLLWSDNPLTPLIKEFYSRFR